MTPSEQRSSDLVRQARKNSNPQIFLTPHHDPWALNWLRRLSADVGYILTDFLNDRPRRTLLGGRWVGSTKHASPGNVLFFNSPGSFPLLPRPPPLSFELWVIQKGYWPVPIHSPRMKRCKLANYYHYLLECPKIGKKIVPTIYQISTWNVLFSNIFILKNLTCLP